MNPIVNLLFSSNITFPEAWEKEAKLGALSEALQRLGEKLGSAQPELWSAYLEQAEAMRDWERLMEFERGFFMALQLVAEAIRKAPSGTYQTGAAIYGGPLFIKKH